MVNPQSTPQHWRNNAITGSEGGFKGCQSGVKVKKRPFQAGNLTEKIPILYREPYREYDRELKLNSLKRGLKYPENGRKCFLASMRGGYEGEGG